MNQSASQESTRLTWIRRAAAALMALLAAAGFSVSAGLVYGHGEIERRVARLAGELGIAVNLNRVDLGFGRHTTGHHIAIAVPNGPRLSIGSAEADLDLADLLQGRRRPSELTLSDLRVALTVTRHGVVGLEPVLNAWRRRRAHAGDAGEASPRTLTVRLDKARAHLIVADESLPPIELVIDDITAVVTKTGSHIGLTGSGSFELAGVERTGTVHAVLDGARIVSAGVTVSRPIWLPVEIGGRRLLVSATSIARRSEAGETVITGIAARDGVHSVAARRLILSDGGAGRSSGAPALRDVTRVTVESAHITRDDDSASASVVDVDLAWVSDEKLPRVRAVTARDGRVESPGRGLVATVKTATGTLRDVPTTRPRSVEDLAAALQSVTFDAPTATVTAPTGQLAALLPERLRRYLAGADAPRASGQRRTLPATTGSSAGRAKRLVTLMRSLQVRLSDGLVEFKERDRGDLITLDNLAVRLAPKPDDRLSVEVDAMVVRAGQPTGQVRLTTTVDADGRPLDAEGLVAGQDVAHLVSTFSKYVSVPPQADIAVAFSWSPPTEDLPAHTLTGTAKLNNFGFEAWRVSHVPISGIKGKVEYSLTYDPQRKRASLRLPMIQIADATMKASLDLTLPTPDRKPKFKATLAMPTQDCAAVRRSIPAALLPRLAGLKVRGSMWFDATLDVDMDHPKALKLDVSGSMNDCAILTLGEIDVAELKGPYVHHPVEPKQGVRKDISVGPGTSQWVSSRSLPRFVKAAAIVTEDRGYWGHDGVRFVLVRRALKLNLKHGRFVYGGSTITQQLVKNIYLSREKTMARKLEEAIIALQMERELTKDEILTLYVNVVEFGPSIYGVKRASRVYFGKHPRHLSPLEAAFIMGLKPWPRGGYKQWTLGRVNGYWVKRLQHILDMMQRREGSISAEEVEAAAPYQPGFRPKGASFSWGKPYERPDGTDRGLPSVPAPDK